MNAWQHRLLSVIFRALSMVTSEISLLLRLYPPPKDDGKD